MNTPHDDLAKEKKVIEDKQDVEAEDIIEVDEAAQSAEGLKNRDADESEGIAEDREHIQDSPMDIPDTEVKK